MKPKKYSDLSGVVIDANAFPAKLRHLSEDFKQWSFTSDGEIDRQLERLSVDQLKALVEKWEPYADEIQDYALANKDKTPVPDEAALVQVFLGNMRNIQSEYRLRTSPWRKR